MFAVCELKTKESTMGVKTEIAREYSERFKSTPTTSLARAMAKDYPNVFEDAEQARSSLRYVRGSHGKSDRKECKDKSSFVDSKTLKKVHELPKGHAKKYSPYNVPNGKYLVLADVHVPYHDKKSVELAINHAKGKVDGVILLGDIMDMYSLSRYCRNPRARDFASELDDVNMLLDYIDQEIGGNIIYKMGNHEQRYEAYMYTRAPEMLGVDAFQLKNLLRFKERGVKEVGFNQIMKFGHLTLLHGHEYRGMTSPVNPARGMFMRANDCTLSGHNHQTSHHAQGTIAGKAIGCWSVGCLCELHPDYMPLNKWNHGFAIIEREGMKFSVSNKRIIKGEVYNG
jgi:predicted phosphodiesterase